MENNQYQQWLFLYPYQIRVYNSFASEQNQKLPKCTFNHCPIFKPWFSFDLVNEQYLFQQNQKCSHNKYTTHFNIQQICKAMSKSQKTTNKHIFDAIRSTPSPPPPTKPKIHSSRTLRSTICPSSTVPPISHQPWICHPFGQTPMREERRGLEWSQLTHWVAKMILQSTLARSW